MAMEIKPLEEPLQNKILLEETFYVLSKKSSTFKVRLTPKGLHLIKDTSDTVKEQLVLLKDIIGCQCLRSKRRTRNCTCQSLPRSDSLQVVEENSSELDDTDCSAYLYIYAYIFQGTSKKRERTIITLRFRSFDKYEDNNKEAQRWRSAIKKLIKEPLNSALLHESVLTTRHRETRRLLVLCNPKSGAGKGKQIFQQKVAPLLMEAEIPYDLHMTKCLNFAREFVRTSNLYQWTGIIAVGGDGIVFEIINGLFERPDWSAIVKSLPIGVVPGGSGNGLARSIAHHSAEPYSPTPTLPATLAAIRGASVPMDLVRVETLSQILFSFLSVGWGLLSDIDIESERLRVLGGTRFTVWSVARLIGLRSYRGKLWYLPCPNPVTKRGEDEEEFGSPVNGGGSTLELSGEVLLETEEGRPRVDSWYSAHSRRSDYFSTGGSSYQSTADSGLGDGDGPRRMYGPAPTLPSLAAPLPDTWRCIEGRFVMVHASYQTHLGEECLMAPEASPNDGRIWLLIVKHGASRSQMLQFMLGLTTGAHAASGNRDPTGNIELVPVSAFRIEPDMRQQGYLTVDGEHVEYGPIQAEIFPELGRVMVP
ncbi:sphingosine kinase 2-like [Anthonomus grandis grandis]|uniref:sphingosine kinase 2-like n=1 Tax=Anthonomus grandis grandis TaxID=2921223 RepID=UPI0021660F80|nr:sphingosine kinase 2-like [Anthonomus grandis grandis]